MTSKKKEREIKIELTEQEVNTVLESLGHMPFMRVYKIIEKIHLQANKAHENGEQ